MSQRWGRREATGWLLLGVLVLSACGAPAGVQQQPVAPGGQTVTVQRGDIEVTVSASGAVIANADANLIIQGGGMIKEFLVRPGDRVKAGQKLVNIDDRDLKLQLTQAEANLASAQAKYEQAKAGATDKERQQAEASLRSAQAKYQQTMKGDATAQDLANAEASLRSAQAKLDATRSGTTTAQDLANAEASLRSAQAKLDAVKTGSVLQQDIENAEAGVRSAEAKLADLMAPPDLNAATERLNQAKQNHEKSSSQLSNSKEQARIAMLQAADDLRSAQSQYGAAKLVYEQAVETGKDPNVSCPSGAAKGCGDLTDAKLRQYKADFESKQQALSKAEQQLEARRLAYDDAKQQEINGLRVADSQVADAQAALDTQRAGPTAAAITQAQALVDQARSNLEKLRQPVKDSDIVQAQASVDQARSNLEKLRQPATSEDVTVAQAAVDQAQASLADIQSGPKALDLAVALASVKQSEAARDLQRLKLDQATLVAPFDGVVAAINGAPGQLASTSATAPLVALVDDTQLRIDIQVAESDMARLKVGQDARVSFDALADRVLTGRVSFIAPKASVTQNVVSYPVSVVIPGALESSVRPGMTANVAVVIDRKQDVLLAPSRVIRTVGRERVVEVRYKGLIFSTPVQVGMVGDTGSEILSGLLEGDTVVINTQPTNRVQLSIQGPGSRR